MTMDTVGQYGVIDIGSYDNAGAPPESIQPPAEYLVEMRDWAANYLAPKEEIDGLIEIITEAWKEGRKQLYGAILKHAMQKADDRCWIDDVELYRAAGITVVDNHVGDKFEMLKNCSRFIEKRCAGGTWPTYAEIEIGLKRASYLLTTMEQTIQAFRETNLKQ